MTFRYRDAKSGKHVAIADDMLQGVTHDELVEALKILALNLAAYKAQVGKMPQTVRRQSSKRCAKTKLARAWRRE